MSNRGLSLGLLLLSGWVAGCVSPLPTSSVGVILSDPPAHVRYVTPDHAVPYADLWDDHLQILLAFNETRECGLNHLLETTRITVLYDCFVSPLGQVSGTALRFEGKDASRAISGGFTGTLDSGGLTGLASTTCTGVCGSFPLSKTLALVPEIPAP